MLLFKSNQSKVLALVFIYFFSVDIGLSASLSEEKKVIENVILAVGSGQWKTAESLSEKLNEPEVKTFINWAKLREGVGSFEDYKFFLNEYAHWPGLRILRQKGEAPILKKTEPQKVIAYFKNFPPSTGFGATSLIDAYEKLNNTTVGEYYLVNVPYYSIKNGTIPEYVEQLCQLEKILPESLAPDEYKYVSVLLQGDAGQYMQYNLGWNVSKTILPWQRHHSIFVFQLL